mmetsp:Transcript_19797/g.42108  ORF Transcript_19797/g.42108 Transcript_19797/m.42108 type:complete len:228 (+) Transcript_19797:1238-1921(+)
MASCSIHDFITLVKKLHTVRHFHRPGNQYGKIIHRSLTIRTDEERLVARFWHFRCHTDNRRNIINVREAASLFAVAEDRHRQVMQHLIHENADGVSKLVSDVLTWAINIVWPEDDEIHSKHLLRSLQVKLRCQLGDAVRVFRMLRCFLDHWKEFGRSERSNRRGEHEALDTAHDRLVDQLNSGLQVVAVVEPSNEMRKPLGCVCCQMVDIVEGAVLGEKLLHSGEDL